VINIEDKYGDQNLACYKPQKKRAASLWSAFASVIEHSRSPYL